MTFDNLCKTELEKFGYSVNNDESDTRPTITLSWNSHKTTMQEKINEALYGFRSFLRYSEIVSMVHDPLEPNDIVIHVRLK